MSCTTQAAWTHPTKGAAETVAMYPTKRVAETRHPQLAHTQRNVLPRRYVPACPTRFAAPKPTRYNPQIAARYPPVTYPLAVAAACHAGYTREIGALHPTKYPGAPESTPEIAFPHQIGYSAEVDATSYCAELTAVYPPNPTLQTTAAYRTECVPNQEGSRSAVDFSTTQQPTPIPFSSVISKTCSERAGHLQFVAAACNAT